MTGPEHYKIAEQLIDQVQDKAMTSAAVSGYAAVAQVHATLALVEAIRHGNG